MTTTNNYMGLSTEAKPSSRVLAPPGGGSSNIFGYDDTAERRAPQDRNQNTAAPVANYQQPPPQQQQQQQRPPQQQQQKNRGEAPYASFAESGTNSTPSQFNHGGPGSQNDQDFRCYSVSAYRDAAEQSALTRQRARGQASGAYNILTNEDHQANTQSQFRDYERSQAQAAQQYHQQQQQQHQEQQQGRRAPPSGGSRTRGAYNPITGEDYPVDYGKQNEEEKKQEETKEEQQEEPTTEPQAAAEKPAAPVQPEPDTTAANKPHTSTRVRQPPGGASSKLW